METSTTHAIAKNTLAQLIGKIISTGLGLLAIGMMTRYLGQEQFGWYITTMSFLQFAGILIDFGMIPVTAQMMSEPAFDKTTLFKNLLGFRAASAFVCLGIAPLIALFFPYPIEVKLAIALTSVAFFGNAITQILIGLYQTRLRMHLAALGEVVGRVALVLGLWLVMRGNGSFLVIMGVVTLGSIVQTLYLWFYAAREIRISFAYDKNIWRAIAKKMWPIAISIMCNVVYLKGDAVFLSLMRSQEEVGLYGAAYRVLDIVTQTAMMMMGVMLPLLAYAWSRNIKEDFKKYYQQSFDLLMLVAIPSATGLWILGKPIMALVAGDAFADAGKILAILAIAVFGVYLGAVFGHAAVAINRQKETIWIYASDAVITLIGYLIFIPLFGMYGAAWMTVFSELYAGVLLFFTVRHFSRESLRWNTLGKIIFASAAMALTLLAIPASVSVIIHILAGMVVFAGVLALVGGVSKETLRAMIRAKPIG